MLKSPQNLLRGFFVMKKNKAVFLLISVILIATCLRGPITGVGPLVKTLCEELSLSSFAAGMLTTLPMLAFAVVSLITGTIARKIGAGRTMLISLIVLFIGLLVRSFLGTVGLFVGTVIVGLGIGVNNVLLPAVIKARFPEKMGTLTGVYTTLMAGFASLSSGITVPLSLAIGWNLALCVWIILVAFALIFWIPNVSLSFEDDSVKAAGKRRSVARSSISWFITLYMGFQSMVFYFTVAWFASVLQSYGYSQTTSGYFNMAMMLCGLPGSFIMPIIASKSKHQSFWGGFIGLLYTLGMISLMFAYHPAGLVVTIITNGFGSGACIAHIMILFALHTKDAQDASSLSSLAQGIGYIFAAIPPILVGKILDLTNGSWTVPLLILTGVGIATMVFGWLSGTNRMVNTEIRQ